MRTAPYIMRGHQRGGALTHLGTRNPLGILPAGDSFIVVNGAGLMRQVAVSLVAVTLLGLAATAYADKSALDERSTSLADPRRFTHGIGAAHSGHQDVYIFYSRSSLAPDAEDSQVPWSHDVYVAVWNAASGELGSSRIFIGEPEAQEPVSVAQNASGNIMLTLEDGWKADHDVTQRYGVYDKHLEPVRPYPVEVEPGGHSGHVAAVGDSFVVAYSDGWVNFGGQDNLGSGNGVYAKVYDGSGVELHQIDIVHAQRAWWPVVAGGKTHAMVAWQELVGRRKLPQLKFALIDAGSGELGPATLLHNAVQYYTYNVSWLKAPERFLVVGTADGHGFARVIDSRGRITASLSCLPATVREAGIAVQDGGSINATAYAYIPAANGRLMQLRVEPTSLTLSGLLAPSGGKLVSWHPVGGTGLFASSGMLYWLSLTRGGVEQIRFDLATKVGETTPPLGRPLGGSACQ